MIYSIASPDIAELLAVARKVLTGVLADRVAVSRGSARGRPGGAITMGWLSQDPSHRPGRRAARTPRPRR